MSKFFTGHFISRVILVACCLALIDKRSNALFLGNFIGCNSFGCRIAALEQDVGQLKQQVVRLSGGNPMNFQQQPYNQNQMQQGMNQLPNQFNQNGQQQQQGVQPQQQGQQQQQGTNPATRQGYSAGEYPPELRRIQQAHFQNSAPLGSQFMSA